MKRSLSIFVCAFIFSLATGSASAQHHENGQEATPAATKPALATPSSIVEEHKHLHHQLDEALASGGKTADSARAVADVLLPHFKAEEEYGMLPLGLLQALANDRPLTDEQKHEAIQMAGKLRSHYGQMIQEHQQIHTALESLASAARQENKPEVLAFAETLMLHAQNEEQVLYPTTLLIGKYLESQSAAGQ